MLNPVNSIDATVIERIVYGFPAVAKAIEDAPPEKWWIALEAAEASYIGTLQSSGLATTDRTGTKAVPCIVLPPSRLLKK